MPQNAGANQRQESRRAFYAGAAILFEAITKYISEGDEVRQEDLDLMDSIQAELDQFLSDVIGGKK